MAFERDDTLAGGRNDLTTANPEPEEAYGPDGKLDLQSNRQDAKVDSPTVPKSGETTVQSALKNAKVRYRVEYRELKDYTLLQTKDLTGTHKQKRARENSVFEIVDVNYTDETKDTQTTRKNDPAVPGTNMPPSPSVQWTGNQYIRIHSLAIINALRSVISYYPYKSVDGDPVDIYAPYAILVHHWELLEEFRERFNSESETKAAVNCEVSDTYEHLGILLDFLEGKVGENVRKERKRWSEPVPKVSFDMLWLLLKPGSDVCYDQDDNSSREPFVLADVTFNIFNHTWPEYKIRLWHLTGSEDRIEPDEHSTTITRFHGVKPIEELDVFPCEYLKGYAEWKEKMIERGRKFFGLRRKKCMHFDGEVDAFPRRKYKENVMLDPVQEREDLDNDLTKPEESTKPEDAEKPKESVERKPSGRQLCFCDRCSSRETEMTRPAKFKGYKRIDVAKVEELEQHQYFLCSRSTWAFVLGNREWKLLFVNGFSEPKWNPKLIQDLVIKDHFKTMLQNLSKMFIEQESPLRDKNRTQKAAASTPTPWTADFVENKGKGLVFLLHGQPGVGKTYTAECLSQYVQRPLLTVTCADIGVQPSEVESNLRGWFKKAIRWDAIMLLDEADVYMEYRQIHDLNRNNLVACFLRAIEYYEGILFLTTNRIGTFDEAFLSRINVSLYYREFDDKDRRKIWFNYFDKLERERGNEVCVPYSTKEYATESTEVKDLKWNGREIRNAFQIAVNLAMSEGDKDENGRFTVKRNHIQVTVELSKDFKDYMVSLHKKTESQRAQIMGYRYDLYNNPSKPAQEFF